MPPDQNLSNTTPIESQNSSSTSSTSSDQAQTSPAEQDLSGPEEISAEISTGKQADSAQVDGAIDSTQVLLEPTDLSADPASDGARIEEKSSENDPTSTELNKEYKTSDVPADIEVVAGKQEDVRRQDESAQIPVSEPIGVTPAPAPAVIPEPTLRVRELWAKALGAIQFRKRKKFEKIMNEVASKGAITNDEVEKLLHVSNATATRYLAILVKEGRIRRVGEGKATRYEI